MGEEMTTKILILNKPLIITFNYLRYEWPLEEQMACCEAYIRDNTPETTIIIVSSRLDIQQVIAQFEPAILVVPSKLIFSSTLNVADASIKALTDAGFNVVEAIPNARLKINPHDMSRLLIEGDDKYSSLCYPRSERYAQLSYEQVVDLMEQIILREYLAFSEPPRKPKSRPDTKAVIEHYFKDLNALMLDQIGGTDDNDSLQDDEDK
jgi:hypothetical protein